MSCFREDHHNWHSGMYLHFGMVANTDRSGACLEVDMDSIVEAEKVMGIGIVEAQEVDTGNKNVPEEAVEAEQDVDCKFHQDTVGLDSHNVGDLMGDVGGCFD